MLQDADYRWGGVHDAACRWGGGGVAGCGLQMGRVADGAGCRMRVAGCRCRLPINTEALRI